MATSAQFRASLAAAAAQEPPVVQPAYPGSVLTAPEHQPPPLKRRRRFSGRCAPAPKPEVSHQTYSYWQIAKCACGAEVCRGVVPVAEIRCTACAASRVRAIIRAHHA